MTAWTAFGRSMQLMGALAMGACGGAGPTLALPDESRDLLVGLEQSSSFNSRDTTPVGPDLGGSVWRWVEAECTEGPLDLAARGYEAELRVHADQQGLLFIYDQTFATEECTHTIVQRARPAGGPRQFQMTEEVRISQPAAPECAGTREDDRPGSVWLRDGRLEILVQRSNVWCAGFEVRMAFERATAGAFAGEQIVRHYAAHFNRRDAHAIAALFAISGSLVEPFQVTSTGGPSRHDGRDQIQAWYQEVFAGVEWLTMRLDAVEPGDEEGQLRAVWQYMDPRLEEPLRGKNDFTIAAGEIFETRIELTSEAPPHEPAEAPSAK